MPLSLRAMSVSDEKSHVILFLFPSEGIGKLLFLFGCFEDLLFAFCFQKVDYDVSWCEFFWAYLDGV